MNYAEFTQAQREKRIYNVTCFNDMGHFNYYIDGYDLSKVPHEISNFIFDHIYKNYIGIK